jgi:hypothetical protein
VDKIWGVDLDWCQLSCLLVLILVELAELSWYPTVSNVLQPGQLVKVYFLIFQVNTRLQSLWFLWGNKRVDGDVLIRVMMLFGFCV